MRFDDKSPVGNSGKTTNHAEKGMRRVVATEAFEEIFTLREEMINQFWNLHTTNNFVSAITPFFEEKCRFLN